MKTFRIYIVCAIFIVSSTLGCAFVCVADENARKISLGAQSAAVAVSFSNEELPSETTNLLETVSKLKENAKKAAGFIPPPFGCLYKIATIARNSTNHIQTQ